MSLYGKEIFIHVGCMLAGKLSKSLHGQRSPGWGEEPKKPVIHFLRPSWRKKREKNPFCCWIYSARLLLSIRSCKFMVVGTKSFFFLLSRVTGTVKFDWSANFDPLKESVLNLTFTKEKKKMVKFYIAELYNLFPSFELAWLLSFSWEWGYKFWRKKNPTEVRYATWNWKQNTQWSILSPCLLIFFIYLRTFLGRGAVFALNTVWDELLVL